MMKKTIAAMLSAVFIFLLFVLGTAYAGIPEDVANTDYEQAVEFLMEKGIVSGYPDGTFKPDAAINRAEFAKIAVLASGVEISTTEGDGGNNFSDVQNNHWAVDYINTAVKHNLVEGYPDGSFRPNAEITYEQAAAILIRMLGDGPEVDRAGEWPMNYIEKSAELGITEGITFTKWDDAANRGNTALMLYNALTVGDTQPEEDGGKNPSDDGSVELGYYLFGVVTEKPWKTVDGYMVTINVAGVGEKDFPVHDEEHGAWQQAGNVVAFRLNSSGEAVYEGGADNAVYIGGVVAVNLDNPFFEANVEGENKVFKVADDVVIYRYDASEDAFEKAKFSDLEDANVWFVQDSDGLVRAICIDMRQV